MEIRYQHPQATFAKLLNIVSREIYKGNKLVKYLALLDIGLFVPYFALIVMLFLKSHDWIGFLNNWYENRYASWIRWILLIGFYVIFCYVTIVRPRIMNRIVRAKVLDEQLGGEQIVRIQEDGLYGENPVMQCLFVYSYISQVQNINQYLMVFTKSGHFIAVPHNAFQDENHRLEFENLLRAKIADQSEAV